MDVKKIFWITLFLGWLGVHKFMEHKIGIGLLYLFTLGLCGIGWIYDTVKAGLAITAERKQHQETIQRMIEQCNRREQELEAVKSYPSLAPDTMDGKKQSYQYQDIQIHIDWQYGGRYGKNVQDTGATRGSVLNLVSEPTDESPGEVSVYLGQTKIGVLLDNRLRDMVHAWKNAGLPIYCVASFVGGEHNLHNLLIELAFYGKPHKS